MSIRAADKGSSRHLRIYLATTLSTTLSTTLLTTLLLKKVWRVNKCPLQRKILFFRMLRQEVYICYQTPFFVVRGEYLPCATFTVSTHAHTIIW